MSSFFIVLYAESFDCTISQQYDSSYWLSGDWEVALTHLKLEGQQNAVFVFCDLVEYCHINDTPMQLLDVASSDGLRNGAPKYVKVARKRFSNINVNIRANPALDDLQSNEKFICVLHFRKV
jgi:hypothetical protein